MMKEDFRENIIIGAGPAGLQLAYFLEKSGRDYIVLEAEQSVGSFFKKYPRTRSLISFNRAPYPTGDREFQWRGDWNSLLADDGPRFRDYDQRLLPDADSMVKYLEAFAEFHQLNVNCSCRASSVQHQDDIYRIDTESGERFTAKRLFIATGLKPRLPEIPGIESVTEHYCNASTNEDDYVNQRVMILGKRNSALEIANIAQQTASIVLMVSPNPLVLAWNSKHSGHARANLIAPLDTYQLKLILTKLLDATVKSIEVKEGKYFVTLCYTHAQGEVETFIVDRLINCTGFAMNDDLFVADDTKPGTTIGGRFAALTDAWESVNQKDLFFIGAQAQCNDFQKASSPFVAGFRYNIRSLFHMLEEQYYGISLPYEVAPRDPADLARWLVGKITSSAGIFFQFGYLGDVLILSEDGLRYYRELPVSHIHERFCNSEFYVVVMFGWGDFEGDVFAIPRQPQGEDAHHSAFIHPVLRVFQNGKQVAIHHLLEDLFAVFCASAHDSHYVSVRAGMSVGEWHTRHHVEPLEKFLRKWKQAV